MSRRVFFRDNEAQGFSTYGLLLDTLFRQLKAVGVAGYFPYEYQEDMRCGYAELVSFFGEEFGRLAEQEGDTSNLSILSKHASLRGLLLEKYRKDNERYLAARNSLSIKSLKKAEEVNEPSWDKLYASAEAEDARREEGIRDSGEGKHDSAVVNSFLAAINGAHAVDDSSAPVYVEDDEEPVGGYFSDEDGEYSSELPEDDEDEYDEEDSSELPDDDEEGEEYNEDSLELPDDDEEDSSELPEDDDEEYSSELPDDDDEYSSELLDDDEEDSSELPDDDEYDEDSSELPEDGDEDYSELPDDEEDGEDGLSELPEDDDDEYSSELPDDEEDGEDDFSELPGDDDDEGYSSELPEDDDEEDSSELPDDDEYDDEDSSELPDDDDYDEEDSSELPDDDDEYDEDSSELPDDDDDEYDEDSSELPDDDDEYDEDFSELPADDDDEYDEEDSSELPDDDDEDSSELPPDAEAGYSPKLSAERVVPNPRVYVAPVVSNMVVRPSYARGIPGRETQEAVLDMMDRLANNIKGWFSRL